jgi:hypothetical protein
MSTNQEILDKIERLKIQRDNVTRQIEAIEKLNDDIFEDGIENLKSLFRFTGILTIIMLSLYAVGIISVLAVFLINM